MTARYVVVACECGRMHGIRALPASRSRSGKNGSGGVGKGRHSESGARDTASRVPPLPTTGNRERRGEPPVVPVPRERIGTLAGPARHDRGTGSPSRASRSRHRPAVREVAGESEVLTHLTDGGSRPA